MGKYLFVYRNLEEHSKVQPTPEEIQAIMQQWQGWFETVGADLIDGGDGLLPTGKIVGPDGTVTDGPFIEAKELVGGYSVIQASDYDQAAEYAKTCPIVHIGGSIEIRELAGFKE